VVVDVERMDSISGSCRMDFRTDGERMGRMLRLDGDRDGDGDRD